MSGAPDQHDDSPAAAPDDEATVLYRRPPPAADDEATVLAPGSVRRAAPPAAAASVPVALPPGTRLLEYRIDAVLGQGGFGITYLATDVHLNAKVAIKEYLPAGVALRAGDQSVAPRWPEDVTLYQSGLDSFLVEARTLATFRHPNIVRVARFFEAHRTAYMVLEYERGRSLRAWWKKRRVLPENELLDLLRPLLDGLNVVHAAGFLHRDIKPDNIIVRRDDGSLVLLDFGAARATVGPAGAMGAVVTPGYAPPEQYEQDGPSRPQGPWTDIYALGATLYWMVAGAKPPPAPARASGAETMRPALEAGEGRYGEAFLRAIDWALQLDPDARPQTLDAFSAMLFASHTGSLALADALRAGDAEPGFGSESLRVLLESPQILKRRALRLGRALLRPASWPMTVKMTIAMVVAALAPMLITAWYNYDGSVNAVSAAELRNLERIAQSTAGRVGQLVKDSENLAGFVSTDSDMIAYLAHPDSMLRERIEARLRDLTSANDDVDLIFLMDANGVALLSTDPAVLTYNFGFREYFRSARQGTPFKTGILVGTRTRTRGTYFSYPVLDRRRRVLGVVALRIRAATFSAMLAQVGAGTGRTAFLVDGDGVLIDHPDARWLHHSLTPLPDAAQARIAADQRFDTTHVDSLGMPRLAAALVGARQSGSVSYHSTITDRIEHAGYAPVPHHDWVVGVTESRDTFEAPLRRLFANVKASVLLVGLAFLVLAVLFARSIVRPIARLTEAANALKEGDYGRAHIRVSSDDEIGRLARTFNVMIDVLRQRERERTKPRRRAQDRRAG
jgi:serine/threonine protein kinase/HAMP domain-containing protein